MAARSGFVRVLSWCSLALLAGVAAARADEIWQLTEPKSMTGHAISVVGKPEIAVVEGATAMRFDGAHDGLFVAGIPTADAKEFTIEVLLCPAEGGNEAQRFFHLQDAAGRRALMEIRTNGHGSWWLDAFLRTNLAKDDKGLTLIDPRRVHPTNRWHWVAMRCDGHRLESFVNGVKELEGERDFVPLADGKVSIGVRQNLVYWFKGAVREVRFHREALPDEKLQRAD